MRRRSRTWEGRLPTDVACPSNQPDRVQLTDQTRILRCCWRGSLLKPNRTDVYAPNTDPGNNSVGRESLAIPRRLAGYT